MNLKLLDLNSEADYFLLSNTLFRLVIFTISLIKLWLDISNLLSTSEDSSSFLMGSFSFMTTKPAKSGYEVRFCIQPLKILFPIQVYHRSDLNHLSMSLIQIRVFLFAVREAKNDFPEGFP
jgi:hypothetical protein